MKRKTTFDDGQMSPTEKAELANCESGKLLIYNVIKSGMKDKDIVYFEGDTFIWHCELLGLDEDLIRIEAYKTIGVKYGRNGRAI